MHSSFHSRRGTSLVCFSRAFRKRENGDNSKTHIASLYQGGRDDNCDTCDASEYLLICSPLIVRDPTMDRH